MKLDMCFKNIKKYNSTVKFSKYVVMLNCLVKIAMLQLSFLITTLHSGGFRNFFQGGH